jgi:gamma-glutamylcyclotransferase (GGCT)/AIG2-like uncharacterized protein YtfP
MARNPILYIGGPGYTYDQFAPMIDQVSDHFDEILRALKITGPDGENVEIRLFVEVATPEKIRAHAVRVSKEPHVYEIRMTAGLSYHLWLVSRALESDANYLSWVKNIKILDPKFKKVGRKKLLADYAYYLGSYLILLHEISHVVLGHCDYVQDNMNFEHLDEFEDEKRELTSEEVRIRKAFEAEADRQSGEFLIAFFEESLSKTGLGSHVKFPSRKHAYEFYTYSITLVCVLLQQLTRRQGVVHPKPNERQYIIISSISKYFEKYNPEQLNLIQEHATLTMLKAAKKTGLIDGDDPLKVMQNAISLAFVDDVVEETKIREFQLGVS